MSARNSGRRVIPLKAKGDAPQTALASSLSRVKLKQDDAAVVGSADYERLAPARALIGYDAPAALLEDVNSSLKACFRDGGTSPDCEGRALIFAKNRGWYRTMHGWEKREERKLTFAETVDRSDFNAPRFYAPKVELVREGTWPIGEDENGDLVYADFTRDLILAFRDGTNELHDRLKPMATMGHVSDDAARQLPAAGLAGRLATEEIADGPDKGKLRLVTNVSAIPAAMAVAIENKGLNRVSIDGELNYYDTTTQKHYPAVVKRFALLGGTTPRITGMEDLPKLYREDSALEWEERPVSPRVIELPTGYHVEGHRIAAAEGAGPFSFRRIALEDVGRGGEEEEMGITKEELAAALKEIVPGLVKAEIDASRTATEATETVTTTETVTAAEGAKKADEKAAPITASEVAPLAAQLTALSTELASMKTTMAEQNTARVAEAAARNSADDDAFFRSLPKGLIAPFEETAFKALMAEGRAPRKISLGEGTTVDSVRDVVVHLVKQRQKGGLFAIHMAEKARMDKDGKMLATNQGADAFKRMKLNPDETVQRVEKVTSGQSFFKVSEQRRSELGG